MNSHQIPQKALEDIKLNVKLKLAALWTSFMFLYFYVDYLGFYKQGYLQGVLEGKVWQFQITQEFLLTGLVAVTIPSLMVFLSVALPAKINRWTNIIVSAIYIPFTLFNLVGEKTVNYFMIFGAVVEVILQLLVIWHAWNWAKQEA
jgi:uncharacterized membrane protein